MESLQVWAAPTVLSFDLELDKLRAFQYNNASVQKHYAQIAQSVEQWTENPRVAGSIPALGIFLFPKQRQAMTFTRIGIYKTKMKRETKIWTCFFLICLEK